ncbi:hypothetical protein [Deinococcus roseus]|uniref:Uncharacterized protein n=1 Tax=Deinococcus roseus TaxID=392414 RepID=A0ABQ2D0R1_9DEIO|nr:hypothetical protein [Deinococcus roseus]GGJ39409.1 hypothetical protein GCM10008938_26850 [Deinococcus roseus]
MADDQRNDNPGSDDNWEDQLDPKVAEHFTISGDEVDPTLQADDEQMDATIDFGGVEKNDEANDISDITDSEESITANAVASIVNSESEPADQIDTPFDLDEGKDDYQWQKSDDPAIAGDEFERRPSPYFRNDDTAADTFTDDRHRDDTSPENQVEEKSE